jgi:hypothetical protein
MYDARRPLSKKHWEIAAENLHTLMEDNAI